MNRRKTFSLCAVAFDLPGLLAKITGKSGWDEHTAPVIGCGLGNWLVRGSREAYVHIEQSIITIELEGEMIYSGDYTTDAMLAAFVSESQISTT